MFLQNSWKKFAKRIRKAVHLTHYNGTAFLGFEILFKMTTIAVALPLFQVITSLTLQVTGYPYLTMENVAKFFTHPLVILELILMIFLASVYSVLDGSAVLYVMDRSYRHNKVTALQVFLFAVTNTRRVFEKKNLKILLYVMLMLPFISLGEIGVIYTSVMVPNFVSAALEKNRTILIVAVVVLIVLYLYMLKRVFVFHYFTLEQDDCKEAVKRSKQLARTKWLKDGIVFLGIQLVFYLLSFVLMAFGIVLVLMVAKLFSELHLLTYVYTSAVWGLIIVVILLTVAIGNPVSVITVTTLYFLHKESKKESVLPKSRIIERHQHKHDKKVHLAEAAILCVSLIVTTLSIYWNSTQKVNPQIEYIRTMEVTAHRGASAFFPENTMAAFQGALDFGADWIELDVQQSKDRKIFVMHDRSFFRTTGVRKMSWELDYDEIAELDAGSFLSPNFAGEQIPLLSDVIDFAKENNVRLNIELKPGSQDIDIEKQVVDEIMEKDFVDSCVVTSQVYECLEKVKAYNEEIQTVYVCSFAYGNMNRLAAADAFSVEAASITPGMVSRIHNAGKQIYAWTVNSRKKINRMIDLNVDNIITDRVALAQECIYDSKTSSVVTRYVELLREYR